MCIPISYPKKEAIFNTLDINATELEHFETDKIFPLSESGILIEGFEGRNKDFFSKSNSKEIISILFLYLGRKNN